MVRVFGLLIAALALMAPANAALLTYDFTNSATGDVDPAAPGSTATPFQGSGAVGSTSWTTAAVGQNIFELTVGSVPVQLTDLEIRGRRLNGDPVASARAEVAVSYQIDTGSGYGSLIFVDSIQPGSSYGIQPYDFSDVLLTSGSKIRFVIDTTVGVGNSVSFDMDYVKLNGGAVPEPASMAIFGLMGAGLAVRRFRRK